MNCRQDWHVVSLQFATAIQTVIGSSMATEHAFQAYILGTVELRFCFSPTKQRRNAHAPAGSPVLDRKDLSPFPAFS